MILQQTWEFPKRGNVTLSLTELLTPWVASLIEGQVPRLAHWISQNSLHILKARANDVLSKDLLCFHVYVSWVSETLGAKELLMETVLCFVLVTEGLLPPSSSLPASSPPLPDLSDSHTCLRAARGALQPVFSP